MYSGRDGHRTQRGDGLRTHGTPNANEEGLFTIPPPPPGSYEVTAEATSFAPATRTLTLTVGATVTINYALQLGGVTERVTVAGGAQIIETGATIRTTTSDQQAIREPADQRPPVSGLRDADAHRAGGSAARPAVLCRTARDQRERQRRRRRLQPAVLRRHPRRRAIEQRLHGAAGVGPGVPGRGRRLLGGVRQVHGRTGERHHQVGHERPPRIGVLSESQPRLGGRERVRPGGRPDAAPVRHAPSAARSPTIACSSSGPTSSRSSQTPARSPSTSPASRPATTTARPTTTTGRSKPTSMPPTTPRRCSGAGTTR